MNHVFDDELDGHDPDATHARGPSSRRKKLIAGCLVGALVLAGGVAGSMLLLRPDAAAEATDTGSVATSTARIEQGTLSGTSQAQGTLDYADQRDLSAGAGGTLTAIAPVGSQVSLGGGLYWLDNTPVLLLHGALPAWRAFGSGMPDGPDVLQLEMSLAALGYFDRVPDTEFAASTERAISAWQKALGVERTGRLELGSVVFMAGDVRVGAADVTIGSQVGPGGKVLTVTSLEKRVQVELKLSEQRLAVVGVQVSVSLPGGTETTGTVTAVGVPTEKENNGQKSVIVPVTIALDDPTAAADLQRSSVSVGFPSEQRENVLSVPVEALVALDSKTFGVEVVAADGTTKRVPVTTGLFAGGRVEISGEGITAGADVVVPKS